jgi:hypothetical protein
MVEFFLISSSLRGTNRAMERYWTGYRHILIALESALESFYFLLVASIDLLQMANVLGCLGQDCRLVKLMSRGKSFEVLRVILYIASVRPRHGSETGHAVTQGRNLVVQICSISFLDHIVGCLLDRRLFLLLGCGLFVVSVCN